MNLTGEQWRLIEPILPPPSPSDRGRPPLRYPSGMLREAKPLARPLHNNLIFSYRVKSGNDISNKNHRSRNYS